MQRHLCTAIASIAIAWAPSAIARIAPDPQQPEPTTTSVSWGFDGEDGHRLEARLTIPAGADGPVPVVFFLHGAGPRTFDNPMRYIDDTGEQQTARYLDYHAQQLADRGVAFFRMSKRGCNALPEPFWMRFDKELFQTATIDVLLSDYASALDALRNRPEIDPTRIIFLSSSEGTHIAPRLALRSPEGVIAIAMTGYAQDNAKDTVQWQFTHGPWRNIEHAFPDARDGSLTREEYNRAIESDSSLGRSLNFDAYDTNADGVITPDEVMGAMGPVLKYLHQAIADRNDDAIGALLVQLSASYLESWWDAEPNHEALLRLDIPLAIFHGKLDGTTRVEGVYETRDAFDDAGKQNLTTFIYDDADHDLNWSWRAFEGDSPRGYTDAFDWIAAQAMQPPMQPKTQPKTQP